jgi:hypothetical protein
VREVGEAAGVRGGREIDRTDARECVEQAAPQRVAAHRHTDVAREQLAQVRRGQRGRDGLAVGIAQCLGDACDAAIDRSWCAGREQAAASMSPSMPTAIAVPCSAWGRAAAWSTNAAPNGSVSSAPIRVSFKRAMQADCSVIA